MNVVRVPSGRLFFALALVVFAACSGDPGPNPAAPATERPPGTLTSALRSCGNTGPSPVPLVQPSNPAGSTLPPGLHAQQPTFQLRLHAVRVTDDNGGRATAITREQVQSMVTFANVVHGNSANVRFVFDSSPSSPDFVTVANTALNNIGDVGEGPDWRKALRDGNEIAARHPDKVVVVFRHGPGSIPWGNGFGGTIFNFVIMPQFNPTGNCGFADVVTLPHELGHHLSGLGHTHPGPGYPIWDDAQADFAANNFNRSFFDNDRLSDTPQDPFINPNGCDQSVTNVTLRDRFNNDVNFPLPRTNIMSYYVEGNSMTPQQVAVERQGVSAGPHFSTGARFQLIAQHSGKCLDVFGLSQENDARVVQWDCLGINQTNQHWRLRPVRDDLVQIVAAHSNKCLEVPGMSQDNETQVVQRDCVAEPPTNQLWRLRRRAGNVVSVSPAHSNKCLDVFGVSQMNEAKVVQWDCLGSAQTNQSWRLHVIEPDVQVIANHTGQCLDVDRALTGNQVDVLQYTCWGADAGQQLWKFVQTSSPGTYQVIAKHSNKCLDVAGGVENGVDVVQEACHGATAFNQQWRLVHARGDLFQLVATHSGRCLDVAGVGLDPGTDVVQWDCLGNQQFNQLWRLSTRPRF
jgi:hypothetical protein